MGMGRLGGVGSGGAMVLGKLPVPGRPTNLDNIGTKASCACGGCRLGLFRHFSLFCCFSLFLPLWETPRNRLKYCFKGPLNPKQATSPDLV